MCSFSRIVFVFSSERGVDSGSGKVNTGVYSFVYNILYCCQFLDVIVSELIFFFCNKAANLSKEKRFLTSIEMFH